MTTIKSEKTPINASAEAVYDKLSNLENLKKMFENIPADKIPEDKREMFESLKVTSDSIVIPTGMAGEITLRVADKLAPKLIRMEGEGAPVALSMQLAIEPDGADKCEIEVSMSMEVPAMIKPMITGPVKRAMNQFAQLLQTIPFNA